MLVSPAPHHRALNTHGPKFTVVLSARVFTNYNSNPDYRGPVSPNRVVVVNDLHKMTRTADGIVYNLTGSTETVRVKWSSNVDAVYIDGSKRSFGGNLFDLLNLIDNRSPKAWENKQ